MLDILSDTGMVHDLGSLFTTVVATAAGQAVSGAMAGGGGSPKPTPIPAPPPTKTGAVDTRKQTLAWLQRKKGRRATELTRPEALGEPELRLPTLLGV